MNTVLQNHLVQYMRLFRELTLFRLSNFLCLYFQNLHHFSMMENKTEKTACSFLMLYCLWCDIFNIILGVGIMINAGSCNRYNGLILTAGSGFILIHFASIIYLMFHKKLEIKYHLPATRFLLIVGDIFLLTFTLLTTRERLCDMWDSVIDIRDVQLASICAGVSWSLICALWAAASLCKCTNRQRTSSFSTGQKGMTLLQTLFCLCLI